MYFNLIVQKLFQFIFSLSVFDWRGWIVNYEMFGTVSKWEVVVVFSLSIYSCFYWKLVDLGDKLLSLNKSFLGCNWHSAPRTWWSDEWNVNFFFFQNMIVLNFKTYWQRHRLICLLGGPSIWQNFCLKMRAKTQTPGFLNLTF